MRNFLYVILFVFGGTSCASAALQSRMIAYTQEGTVMEGYLTYDDSLSGKSPGIVVAHEWMGLNDYAKRRADMLAQLGYVAFAADVYGKGVRPTTTDQAGQLATYYKNKRPLLQQRMQAALDVLKAQPNVDPSRLGAIGYCFGGTAVLELARSGADVKGVVSFHGGLSNPTPEDAKNIKADVLVLHGAADTSVPQEEVAGFENEMKTAGVNYTLIKYTRAKHGFTNPANNHPDSPVFYDASADKRSWEEMKKFFKRIF